MLRRTRRTEPGHAMQNQIQSEENPAMTSTINAPDETALDDPGRADRLDADARQLRDDAGRQRARAEETVQAARAEAARLVAAAEQTARGLTAEASRADRDADGAEETAGLIRHAATLRQDTEDAEQHLVDMVAKAGRLRGELEGLDLRVASLAESAAGLEAGVVAAVDGGNVEEVAQLRTRLAATQEVTAEVQRRRAVVVERLAAIGEDGPERARVASASAAARSRHEAALDRLDPGRPGKRTAAQAAAFAEALQAAGGSREDALRKGALLAVLAAEPDRIQALTTTDAPKRVVGSISADGRSVMVRER